MWCVRGWWGKGAIIIILVYLLYGFHLCTPFNIITMESAIEWLNYYDFNAPDAQWFIKDISTIQLIAKDTLKLAQEHFKISYSSNHIPITFKPGDQVLINIHSLNLPESKGKGLKFTRRFDGPFEITEQVGAVTYWIQLPHSYGIHPMLSITHLEPFRSDDQSNQLDLKSLHENPEEYEVKEIVEQWWVKFVTESTMYKCWWKDHGITDKWIPEPYLWNAKEALDAWKLKLKEQKLWK